MALFALPLSLEAQVALVDDLGVAIQGDVEVCEIEITTQRCRERPAEAVLLSEKTSSVRIEGPRHGPASFDLERNSLDTLSRLVLPRKAVVVLDRGADVSAYDAAGDFARPFYRSSVAPGEPVWLPAQTLLLSARVETSTESGSALGQSAPDLHLVDLAPGTRLDVVSKLARGWSALIRLRDIDGEPIDERAHVSLSNPYGFSADAETQSFGVVQQSESFLLISGIRQPIVRLEITVPSFLPVRIEALSSTPGSFAFHDATAHRGGSATIDSTLYGEPIDSGTCRIIRETSTQASVELEEAREPSPEVLGEALTSSEGRCVIEGLPPGSAVAVLEVATEDRRLEVDREIQILDEEAVRVVLDLHPLRIEGTVVVGDDPAFGYRVVALPIDHRLAEGRSRIVSEPSSDEGEYSLVLWREDDYALLLQDEHGTPADLRRLRLERDEVVDWALHGSGVRGRVVDPQGHGLTDIGVRLFWHSGNRSSRLARTGDDGSFHFPVQGERGLAKVQAGSTDTGLSEVVEVLVGKSETPPVILQISPPARRSGRLLRADGGPATPAWIYAQEPHQGSLSIDTFDPPFEDLTRTDLTGRFELKASSSQPLRIFFGGPGCPLGTSDLPGLPPSTSGSSDIALGCSSAPSNLLIQLADSSGAAVGGAGVILRRRSQGREVSIARRVLAQHLAALGLPTRSDGTGRLALVALEPGTYDVFLADGTSVHDIEAGRTDAFLRTVTLDPWATAELAVTLSP